MKRIILNVIINLLFLGVSFGQQIPITTSYAQFSIETKAAKDGYQKSINGADFGYHSYVGVNTPCLIARANDVIEWETGDFSLTKNQKFVEFVWLGAMDVDVNAPTFTLSVNETELFHFSQKDGNSWSVKNENGALLTFHVKKLDMHEDAHGYFHLKVPAKLVKENKAIIKVEGDHSGAASWIMTFKERNIPSSIYGKAIREMTGQLTLNLEESNNVVTLNLSKSYTEKEATIVIEKEEYSITSDDLPFRGKTTINASSLKNKSIKIFSNTGTLITEGTIGEENNYIALRPAESTFVDYKNSLGNNIWESNFSIHYEKSMVNTLSEVAQKNMNEGVIAFMNSSHQDIAWIDDIEKCIVERDTMLITPILKDAVDAEGYSFDIEDALIIKEYIERHPETKDTFLQLLEEKKISVGASYTQPYEEMYSGEALSRQFYFGRKWLAKELNGYNADTYWNMDVPGRTLQMPQIMAKSGVRKLVISRQAKGLFDWEAPNGDKIITFSLDHYTLDFLGLNQTLPIGIEHIGARCLEWTKGYNDIDDSKAVIPILSDWDMSPAKDYSTIIGMWNRIQFIEKGNGDKTECILPKIELMTTDIFIDKIYNNTSKVKSIKGERPNLWVYIHGPSHQKALLLSRTADRKLVEAEKLSTFALINNDTEFYPYEELNNAWEKKIYPDHGWGGKNGDITDALFKEVYADALNSAEKVIDQKSTLLAENIKFKQKGIPVVVYNNLNWDKEGLITTTVQFKEGEIKNIGLFNSKGKEIALQTTAIELYESGFIKSAEINFVEKINALGYESFFIRDHKTILEAKSLKASDKISTDYFEVVLGNGGIKSLINKANGKELLDTSNFLGGEIFYMTSEGNGAGEFVEVQQPTFENFEQLKNKDIEWTMNNNGPIFTDFSYRTDLGDGVAEGTIRIFKHLPKIDFHIDIKNWEGTMYREYRLAVPVISEFDKVDYQVPYGIVTVGEDEVKGAAGGSASGNYNTPNEELHPRGIENWIAARSDNHALVLTSSVAAADYIDVKDPSKTTLQPILFASRHSCHWEGNPYPQTGNHAFQFSLSLGKNDKVKNNQLGMQESEDFTVVVRPNYTKYGHLSTGGQFMAVDNENIVISAIKKAEDSDEVIVRFYNASNTAQKVKITFNEAITKASLCTILEEEISVISTQSKSVLVDAEGFGIITIKVKLNR